MFLPAPRLDDTQWSDLVEQSRALLPAYAPGWTDHNLSDPGITLLDLLAWFAEMQVFQLDQISERHQRAFLALIGVTPEPPRSARAILAFALPDGSAPVPLPAGLACEGTGPDGAPIGFRTLHPLDVVPGEVTSLTATGTSGRLDVTGPWLRGDPVAPFGTDPQPGATLELSMSAALPPAVTATLAISTGRGKDRGAPSRHHDAEVVWEALVSPSQWSPIAVTEDGTRALTRDGRVDLVLPAASDSLRARYARGTFDAAPWLRGVVLNGVEAEQDSMLTDQWEIAATATIVGAPTPGTPQPLGIVIDPETGAITRLDVTAASAPSVDILGYQPPAPGAPGQLRVAAKRLGTSTGDPGQVFELQPAPVEVASVRVYAGLGSTWRRFHAHADLLASTPSDAHVVLDPETGLIAFGDGWHGSVAPAGHLVLAAGRSTLADRGNVAVGTVDRITGGGPAGVTVTQPLAATGGAPAETLAQAEARAEQLATATTRAVSAADVEWLVRSTPGAQIARVAVIADLHPAFACVRAPGVVTVVVVPWLPTGRPFPSGGLRRAVAAQLSPHRIVGTRFEVTGPRYVTVTVVATVTARRLAVASDVRRGAVEALDAWFDPLSGGAAGAGWPLGRDVVRAEILQVLDDVAGVDHVVALEILGRCGESCGNLCLGPLELPASGAHAITVVPS